ncbi:MAG: hypothetical protein HW412_836, partial [Bacteroidetes bacterium]|nr:hypothetical protein [Bacteroidota bacterium]
MRTPLAKPLGFLYLPLNCSLSFSHVSPRANRVTDEAIVQNLLSEGTSVTWEAFLRRFSNLMLKIIWQFEKDYDEAM